MDEKQETDGNKENISQFRRALPQFLAVSAKNTLALNFGLSIAFPTMVIPALSSHDSELKLDKNGISWLGSLFFIVIPFGCLASGPCIHRFGRKTVMIALCIPFSAAWLLFSFAETPALIYLAVTLHGLINGLLEAPILTYVAEVCEPEWRGMLSSTTVLASLLGVSLQFLIGNYVDWRKAALINIGFPLFSFVCLCFVPESPHWLISRGRVKEAEKGLMWLRGWVSQEELVKAEVDALSISMSSVNDHSIFSWAPYLDKTFLKPFGLVVVSFFIGHFGGMSTLQTYAVSIFEELKSPVGAYQATAAEGFVQLAGALVCVCILPFIGRRVMAITTTLLSGVCLTALVLFGGSGWPALILLLLSVFLINACSKVFPWVLIGEVFSPSVRAVASGMASCIGYAMGFLVNKTWFLFHDNMTLNGVIMFYGVVSVAGAIFYFFYLPETEGRTLDEVAAHFRGEVDLTKARHQKTINKSGGVVNNAFSENV